MAALKTATESGQAEGLKSGLKSRHLTMISIAGVIGGALFVGSGSVIYSAGPAAILAYAIGGLLVLLIMRMLGEMAVMNPDSGSFSTYADRAIGRWVVLPLVGCIGVSGLYSWVGKPMWPVRFSTVVPVYPHLGLYADGDYWLGLGQSARREKLR